MTAVDFSSDGRVWCTGGFCGDLVVWGGEPRRAQTRWETGAASIQGLRLHPSGTHALVSVYPTLQSSDFELRLFDLRNGTWRSLGSTLGALAWDADGSRFAWTRWDPDPSLKSLGAQLCVHDFSLAPRGEIVGAACVVDIPYEYGERLVSDPSGKEFWIEARDQDKAGTHVHVKLTANDAEVREVDGLVLGLDHDGVPIRAHLTCCRVGGRDYTAPASERPKWIVSRDRGQVLLRSFRQSANVYTAAAGAALRGHPLDIESYVVEARFAPDSRLVALDAQGQMHVLRFEEGGVRKHEVLSAHRGMVRQVLWSSDGKRIAASGGGALVFADRRGRIQHRVPGSALIARADEASNFVRIDRRSVQMVDVSRRRQTAMWLLPADPKPAIDCVRWSLVLGAGSNRFRVPAVAKEADGIRSVFLAMMDGLGPAQRGPALLRPGAIDARSRSRDPEAYLLECFQLVRLPDCGQVAALAAPPPMSCGNSMFACAQRGALRVYDEERNLLFSHAFTESPRALAASPSGRLIAVAARRGIQFFTRKPRAVVFDALALHPALDADWLGFVDDERLLALYQDKFHLMRLPTMERVGTLAVPVSLAGKNVLGQGLKVSALDMAPGGDAIAIGVDTRVHLFAIER